MRKRSLDERQMTRKLQENDLAFQMQGSCTKSDVHKPILCLLGQTQDLKKRGTNLESTSVLR